MVKSVTLRPDAMDAKLFIFSLTAIARETGDALEGRGLTSAVIKPIDRLQVNPEDRKHGPTS